jgi:hypothetical protein
MEVMYHPHIYKTKLCQNHTKGGAGCPKKNYCSFAHGRHELRQPKFTGPGGVPGMPPNGMPVNGNGTAFDGSFFTQPDFVPGSGNNGTTGVPNGPTSGGSTTGGAMANGMNGSPPSYPSSITGGPGGGSVTPSGTPPLPMSSYEGIPGATGGLTPAPLKTESSTHSITVTPATGVTGNTGGGMMGHNHSHSSGSLALPPMVVSPTAGIATGGVNGSGVGGNMVIPAQVNGIAMSDVEFRNATDQLKINILDIVDHISGITDHILHLTHPLDRSNHATDLTLGGGGKYDRNAFRACPSRA